MHAMIHSVGHTHTHTPAKDANVGHRLHKKEYVDNFHMHETVKESLKFFKKRFFHFFVVQELMKLINCALRP